MTFQKTVSPESLFNLIMRQAVSKKRLAAMTSEQAAKAIHNERWRLRRDPEIAAITASDEEVALLLQGWASGVETGGLVVSAEFDEAEGLPVEIQVLRSMMTEMKEQTRLLGRMNSVIQLWGALLILGVIVGVLLWLFG